MLAHMTTDRPPVGGAWPEPRLRALQVEELYRYAGPAAGFSFFGAILTLGVLVETNDALRGAVWFAWAAAVTLFRFFALVAYRGRDPDSDPATWGRLVIAANLLAGIQWGVLGVLLFPPEPAWRQIFTIMVITCFVGGSLAAYSAVRGAHEALSIPATIPTTVYVFFFHDGVHMLAGTAALFFSFAIIYYAQKLNRNLEQSFRAQLERDDLIELTAVLNEKLQRENRDLAHRAAVRGMSVESARQRAGRLETLFEHSPLPQVECDGDGRVLTCNLAAERAFGLAHENIVGRPFSSLLAGAYANGKALAGAREAISLEVQVRAADGGTQLCTASFTPLPGFGGTQPGFAVIFSGLEVPAAVK